MAAQFVAPKVGAAGMGTGNAAAGAGAAAKVPGIRLDNFGLNLSGVNAASVLPANTAINSVAPQLSSVLSSPHAQTVTAEAPGLPAGVKQVAVTPSKDIEPAKTAVSLRAGLSQLGSALVKPARGKRSGILGRFFDQGKKHDGSPAPLGVGGAARRMTGLRPGADFSVDHYQRLKELKQVLGEGTPEGAGWIRAFRFRDPQNGWRTARSAGLEGFFFTKIEHEQTWGGLISSGQLGDYFNYLDALLTPVAWTADIRRELAALRDDASVPLVEKNDRLNKLLIRTLDRLRAELKELDKAQWGRSAHTYAIFSRAYNRLRPGKNFFDSLDDEELARIREEVQVDQLWLLDIFEIGDVKRWGTGGGSPYAIKGYRKIKEELGGAEAFGRFVQRAHALGFKVRTDFIPNHTSLDSELAQRHPEAFIHLLPPQHLSDDEIWAQTPREAQGNRHPNFYLIKTRSYPGREGIETKVLIHHPVSDFGLWIDMGQIDYSQKTARAWFIEQAMHLFGDKGVDSIRRDMAYYVINENYYDRWLNILEGEKNGAGGWVREALERTIREFRERRAALNGAEVLEELTDTVKRRYPSAVMDDEVYAFFTGMSRLGADGIYGKNTQDAEMGQFGLFDALKSFNAGAIRRALRNNFFRFWQKGGASTVNFVGNHDEANPVDVFGVRLRAAAAMALLGGPILTYNGFELGTGQREMVGDLPNSVDRNKAIPFDVPVMIRWETVNRENRLFIRDLLRARRRNIGLFENGAASVLEPYQDTPIVAWSASRREAGRQETLLVAGNFNHDWAWGHFKFSAPILGEFGAFRPRADRNYILRDAVHRGEDGRPLTFERTGKELQEQGLFVHLAPGDAHIFEVEELDPSAPATGPPARSVISRLRDAAVSGIEEPLAFKFTGIREELWGPHHEARKPQTWDALTKWLTDSAILAFLPLQVPQIIKNFLLISAGTLAPISILPWMGYTTGILGNMLLLSYFVSKKEAGAARVQAVGVITSGIVLAQIFYAGFMPAFAFWGIAAMMAGGLTLNLLKYLGVFNGNIWKAWTMISGLTGLGVLPTVLWSTFMPQMSVWPAVVTLAGGLIFLLLQRLGKLPKGLENTWSKLSAWTATMLFMFGPIAQLVSNFANPANIAGLSLLTLMLATAGNALMLPRAILTKDRIWLTGSLWAVAMGGWAVMLSMLLYGAVSPLFFAGFSVILPVYLAFIIRQAMKHHGATFRELLRSLVKGGA